MRPRVRRLRRWSFVLTLPIALIAVSVFGVQQGALLVAARLGIWAAVAVAAWWLGGARGETLRDLLMHPRGRPGLAFTPLIVAEAFTLNRSSGSGASQSARVRFRTGGRTAVLRNGPMYRVKVPLSAGTTATARTERVAGDRAQPATSRRTNCANAHSTAGTA